MSTNKYIVPLIDGTHKAEPLERAILGAVMMESNKLAQVITILKTEMFYSDFNRDVYSTILFLFNQGLAVDIMTVTCELFKFKKEKYEYNNLGYEVGIMTSDIVSSVNIIQWCYILVEMWQNRETFYIQNGYYKADTPEETRMMIADKLFNLSFKKHNDWVDASFVANKLIEHYEFVSKNEITGIKMGLSTFDHITGGAKGGQLIVIGARPGVGKSAMINLWSTNAAKEGETVGIINLEMKDIKSFARMVSMDSDIDYWRIIDGKIREDEIKERMMKHLLSLANMPMYFSSSTDVNILDIRAKSIQLHKKNNLGILFIDYLQLIESSGNKNLNREQQVAQMSRGCKLLANELDIPIVLLAQLNRESLKSADKRPHLSNLRESGSIEQDADIVILLHRDIDDDGMMEEGREEEAFMKIAKHRDGKTTGWIPIGYEGAKMKFYEGSKTPTYQISTPQIGASDLESEMPF